MLNATSERNTFLNRTIYSLVSDVCTKAGFIRTAKIYKERHGTWTINYTSPTTNFKHDLKSYDACIAHLTKLGW